ncbi:hypothetical protein [Phyllobacterium salinisoli]|nr:hypothetical protein [Phyllobacterium salinisoli]
MSKFGHQIATPKKLAFTAAKVVRDALNGLTESRASGRQEPP